MFLLKKIDDINNDPIAQLAVNRWNIPQILHKLNCKTISNNIERKKSIIIFPAQLGSIDNYSEFIELLKTNSKHNINDVYGPKLSTFDWIVSSFHSFKSAYTYDFNAF